MIVLARRLHYVWNVGEAIGMARRPLFHKRVMEELRVSQAESDEAARQRWVNIARQEPFPRAFGYR